MTVETMDNHGVRLLSLAIVQQAVEDHEKDIRYLSKHLHIPMKTEEEFTELMKRYGNILYNRKFFRNTLPKSSKPSIQINQLTDIDGDRLCNAIEKRYDFQNWEGDIQYIITKYKKDFKPSKGLK